MTTKIEAARTLGICVTAYVLSTVGIATAADLPCEKTAIAARKLPTGPAQYESGLLRLKNGASMRLQGSIGETNRAKQMKIGDPVAACYGPPTTYADAGPSQTITVLDLANGAYYGSLVGTWPH